MTRFRTMGNAAGLLAMLLAFIAIIDGCGKEDGPQTPEEAVKGMLDAVKERDYAKAAAYIDIEGILEIAEQKMEEQSANLPEDMKDDWKREIDSTGTDHITKQVIDQMRENGDEADFIYEIVDTEYHGDDNATVKVSITEKDGKTETKELPLVRVEGAWKIGMRSEDAADEQGPARLD